MNHHGSSRLVDSMTSCHSSGSGSSEWLKATCGAVAVATAGKPGEVTVAGANVGVAHQFKASSNGQMMVRTLVTW